MSTVIINNTRKIPASDVVLRNSCAFAARPNATIQQQSVSFGRVRSQRNATQRDATRRDATRRDATRRNATQRNATILFDCRRSNTISFRRVTSQVTTQGSKTSRDKTGVTGVKKRTAIIGGGVHAYSDCRA